MTNAEFQRLLDRATRAGQKHRELMTIIGEECVERYGHHYSDVDAEYIIDAIDYSIAHVRVDQFDADMIESIKISKSLGRI